MKSAVKEKQAFVRLEMTKEDLLKMFEVALCSLHLFFETSRRKYVEKHNYSIHLDASQMRSCMVILTVSLYRNVFVCLKLH